MKTSKIFKTILGTFLLVILILGFSVKKEKEYILPLDETLYATRVDYSFGIDYALTFYGVKELSGKNSNNPIILGFAKGLVNWYVNDEIAWCSLLVNYIESSVGNEYSGSLLARSWEEIGEETYMPELGDIVVLWRKSPDSIYGHVGYFINFSEDGKYVNILGGNQGNAINIKPYPIERVLSYRKPQKIENAAFMGSDTIVLNLK